MLRDVSMAGAWPFFVDVCCAKSFLSRFLRRGLGGIYTASVLVIAGRRAR